MYDERSRAALLVLLCSACSSSYQPANSPRIATKADGGGLTLVRDGEEFPVGVFGSDVLDAVRGNPAAEEHALSFRNYMIGGFSVYAGGVTMGFTGLGMMSVAPADSNQHTMGTILGVAGLGAAVAGIVLLVNAPPHLYDAINIYNDAVDARLRQRYYLTPPSYYPPLSTPPIAPPPAPPDPSAAPATPPAPAPRAPVTPLPAPTAPPPPSPVPSSN